MHNRYFAAVAAMALLVGTSACNQGDDPETQSVESGENITNALGGMEGMETASEFIGLAGLNEMLEGDAPYTVLLPNDEAFAKLSEEELQWLRSEDGRPDLIVLLRQHMVPGMVLQEDLEAALTDAGGTVALANLADSPLALRREGSTIQIGDGAGSPEISMPPIMATNGVVYEISALIPPGS